MNNKLSTYLRELEEIQQNVGIREGIFGVIVLLSTIERHPGISSYNLSKITSIPIPICVAIRNEFIKKGWCEKKEGSYLTPLGRDVVRSLTKINIDLSCSCCNGKGVKIPLEEFNKELTILKKYAAMRGQPRTEIDQSFATPETSISRVLYIAHKYDILRQNFIFLGDSDLTSIALALFSTPEKRIVVVDIDKRVGEIIKQANRDLGTDIIFIEYDLRQPLPIDLQHKFHCVITDPPYTLPGVELFISRAIKAIDSSYGGVIYLSFGYKPPDEMLKIQQSLTKMNCIITDIVPKFNVYIGAQKLGGRSILLRLITTKSSTPIIENAFTGDLYTGDLNPILRFYRCTKCGEVYRIGRNGQYQSIEQLKRNRCKKCGNNRFQKIREEKVKF